ncbi:unnamed protein product [Closterium sp. NIES-54]
MSSQSLILGVPRVLSSLPPLPKPPCGPSVEGRLRATPHSSFFRLTTEPFETLHLDVWGPASHHGPERERFFLVVVDDYSRYTTVFPLAKKSELSSLRPRGLGHGDCTHLHDPRSRAPFSVALRDKISPRAIPCVFLSFPEDSSDFTFYHPPLHQFLDSLPPPPLFLTPAPPPAPPLKPPPPWSSFVWCVTRYLPPSVAPQVPPPSPQSSSQPTADPAGAGVWVEDSGGASSRAGVSRAVPGGATAGGAGAPSAGTGEPGADRVASGGAGSGGGATGALEGGPGATTAPDPTPPPHPYLTQHQDRLRCARAAEAAAAAAAGPAAAAGLAAAAGDARGAAALAVAAAAATGAATAATSASCLWPSDPWSPLSLSSLLPFSSCLHPPCSSLSVLPSPPESALTASLSTLVTDYYRTYRPVLLRVLTSLVTHLRASLSSVSALTAAVTEFTTTRFLDYTTRVAAAPPTSPLAIGGESFSGFGLQHSTVQRTPLAVDHRLIVPFPNELFEPSSPYAELVGCLMYLMTCTRPDLAFPLSVLARFVAPGRHRPVHWTTVVRLAKYLATTSGKGLVLGGRQSVVLTGHCDSSYADDVETHRSTQGYCFSLGSGAVSWRSLSSSFVSTSTADLYR